MYIYRCINNVYQLYVDQDIKNVKNGTSIFVDFHQKSIDSFVTKEITKTLTSYQTTQSLIDDLRKKYTTEL